MRRRFSGATIRRALIGDFSVAPVRTVLQRLHGRPVTIARAFRARGLERVEFGDGARLLLGTTFYGFADRHTRGLLRVRGHMRVSGDVVLAAGCRIDVLEGAALSIGPGTYFSPNVLAVVGNGLTIGAGCAIAWDVSFLDDDRHSFRTDDGVRPHSAPITIGDHVWIGSGSHVYKGVSIADGCVVAGHSTVTRSFDEPGTLIGGTPARVIRRGITWE